VTHERLSVHNVTFYGAPLTDLQKYWTDLAVTRLSMLDSQLLDPQFPKLLQDNNYSVEAVYHLFAGGTLANDPRNARTALNRVIDAACSPAGGVHSAGLRLPSGSAR
jgi:hypothetical protein